MEENNKMIAEFMRKEYNADIDCWKSIQNEKVILEYSNQLLYDTSWNSLMPVISKCAILNNEEGFEPFADICELDLHSEHPTYKEVIRFIKLQQEKRIYYNVWTTIEKVTITNGDEVYEDLELREKVGQAMTEEEARDIQIQLSKEFESTYIGTELDNENK